MAFDTTKPGLAPIRRANQQLREDVRRMESGQLGLSEGEIEQIAGAGQAAAANQAAQQQQEIARASMGQPGFVGAAAKQSAAVAAQAGQAAASSKAGALAMHAKLKRDEASEIKARLDAAKSARTSNIFESIGLGLQAADMVGKATGVLGAPSAPAVSGPVAPVGQPLDPVKTSSPATRATKRVTVGGREELPPYNEDVLPEDKDSDE